MDDDSNKVKSALAQLGTVIEDLSKREVPSAGAIVKRVLEHQKGEMKTQIEHFLKNQEVDLQALVDAAIAQERKGLREFARNVVTEESKKFELTDRSLSGNKIHGGRITKFQSTGIVDEATRPSLNVNDRGITTTEIRAERWEGDAHFTGALTVDGDLTVDGLHVKKLTSDNRLERSSSLTFEAEAGATVVGKGLQWRDDTGPSRQFIYRMNNERLWSSEDLDVQAGKVYRINNREVLSETALGPGITQSNLRKVGTLNGLNVVGNVNIDEFLFWDSEAGRLGIGTEAPNAILSLVSLEAEFIVDVDQEAVRVGTWTTDDLHIITDDTARISVTRTGKITLGTRSKPTETTVYGALNVNVNNPTGDVDIETAGPIRIAGRKFSVGSDAPKAGSYRQGDKVWNDNPKPTGWAGWICIRTGTPGIWKTFGQIGS